jgi:hypothetical protein
MLCFDFVLGTQYLLGSVPSFRARVLFDPADPDASALAATISKWTAFYKAFRGPRPSGSAGVLTSTMVHIARPDSRSLEAVVHLTSDESTRTRGLLAVINPTARNLTRALSVPLYYSGLGPGTTVSLVAVDFESLGSAKAAEAPRAWEGGEGESYTLGEGCGFTDILVPVSVPANSYAAYLVQLG